MSKVDIYYFTGTGNSLHVAKELQKRIPEANLIPMVRLLNQDIIKTSGEIVGLVFPIYFTAIPMPVNDFIKKLNLTSTRYIFAITTRIGTTHSAFWAIDKILKKQKKRLDSYFTLNMASNDPKFNYQVPTEEAIAELELVVQARLDFIQKVIVNQETNREKDNSYLNRIPFVRLLSSLVTWTQGLKVKFYYDSRCSGCGVCEEVCPSQKIKMVNGKPSWQERVKCFHCAACLNFCPVQAAQIKYVTEKNGRYSHPYATVADIGRQKGVTLGGIK